MTPHRCPVCLGSGIVDESIYTRLPTTTTAPCRSCGGTGVLWSRSWDEVCPPPVVVPQGEDPAKWVPPVSPYNRVDPRIWPPLYPQTGTPWTIGPNTTDPLGGTT